MPARSHRPDPRPDRVAGRRTDHRSRAGVIAAVVAGTRMRIAMTCAVVDQGGQLVAFERMDGADLVTITLAQDKAWTALVNRMPTGDLAALAQPGAEFYGYDSVAGGRTIIFDGGLPLECVGVLVGGVGVSGGDTAQDAKAVAKGRHRLRQGPPEQSRNGVLGTEIGSGTTMPASEARASARSVRSQGRSRSGRPKWP